MSFSKVRFAFPLRRACRVRAINPNTAGRTPRKIASVSCHSGTHLIHINLDWALMRWWCAYGSAREAACPSNRLSQILP